MNDLRSRNRTLAPVPSLGPRTGEIVSSTPKPRPPGNPLFQDSRPLEDDEPVDEADEVEDEEEPTQPALSFPVSRELRSMPVTVAPDEEPQDVADPGETEAEVEGQADDNVDGDLDPGRSGRRGAKGKKNKAPASRPTKRREVFDAEDEDDKFPWHYQFDDDEPEELQAKSPLLSRAFRSSVG